MTETPTPTPQDWLDVLAGSALLDAILTVFELAGVAGILLGLYLLVRTSPRATKRTRGAHGSIARHDHTRTLYDRRNHR